MIELYLADMLVECAAIKVHTHLVKQRGKLADWYICFIDEFLCNVDAIRVEDVISVDVLVS